MATKRYMKIMNLPKNKFRVSFSRSSGSGGQNVNKVNTKVSMRISIEDIDFLGEKSLERLKVMYKNRINNKGEIYVTSEKNRTQAENIDDAFNKFKEMFTKASNEPKPRIRSKPPKSANERRLAEKKYKKNKVRKRKNFDEDY
ncbi:hypothetical protein MHBO_001884 [Bonamia ostreae]|uniref:Prokaryotic-type class I peptide chain release factors domain-containing protein n=1 Tax=Bonamia ostreae TaxID=126728 RepID=A0ABV2AKN4_9EUKA